MSDNGIENFFYNYQHSQASHNDLQRLETEMKESVDKLQNIVKPIENSNDPLIAVSGKFLLKKIMKVFMTLSLFVGLWCLYYGVGSCLSLSRPVCILMSISLTTFCTCYYLIKNPLNL